MTTPLIEISRPGRFVATDGKVWDFTDADLAAAAGAYDPVNEPAPLVVGHPQLDHPAYGWVRSLAIKGGKIVATPEHVHPEFAEAVKAKSYRRVSASWYPPQHPQNPRPGAWYLKHIGFLGGAAPAIRGLAPVHFSEAQLADVASSDAAIADVAFAEQPPADPPEEEPHVADEPNEPEDTSVDFAEREAEITAKELELAGREAAVVAKEEAAAAADKAARHQANVSFAEGMIAGGKLKKFGKDKLVGLLDTLEMTAVVSFGESLGELAPIDVFKEMLAAAEPFVSFGEAAAAEDEQEPGTASFAAPAGFTVDGEAMALHVKAQTHHAAHPELSYIEAVKAVS